MDAAEAQAWAPAKVNMVLRVVGRREDGYHLLESWMVKLDLADRITIRTGVPGLRLRVRPEVVPGDGDNLVMRAAKVFFKEIAAEPGAEMLLEKQIPVAAGLGGGSADAAATLGLLNDLHGRPLSGESLARLGLGLGADVPFFLFPGTAAWAEGVGERLSPAPIPENQYILLVNPGFSVSTAWVFKNYKFELTIQRQNFINAGIYERSFTSGFFLSNDLEAVVLPHHPELAGIRSALLDAGAESALMSGSGPTVFGIFPREEDRDEAARALKRLAAPSWRIIPTRVRTTADGASSRNG